ncbi:uncharacterized protein LOC115422532 isoform X2 [Sphaeramia orbicularis]|uniref:uncharacterized protein LOC115422532 isoform X2 n=1 Tax=Sphaeramia orbicularis TaxID=375764 RepID=UPI0011815BDF|nr:uncharacterized protein LOC115422532 isoform X2 [Sphaeramia orbicularis]
MHNWTQKEIRELLDIRGSEQIRNQITRTVKDSVVYNRIAQLLSERGVYRSHMQIISKLKALRKQYKRFHQEKSGSEPVDWPFYDQCHRAFGSGPKGNQGKRNRNRSPSPPPLPPTPPPPPPVLDEPDHNEVVVELWNEDDDQDVKPNLGPVEPEEDEDQSSSPDQIQSITHPIPTKKRKTSVMEQVSTLVSATVAQLREMDAAMQAQEDARLQRLMDHEREMQKELLSQLSAMHERMGQQNHQRHLELVDRVLSRFPPRP